MRKSAVKAAALTFAHYGGSQLIRLAGNLILTRLLAPEIFGLMALVQVLIYGISMFSDVGLNDSVIRSSRGDDASFLDTIWTLKVIRGLVMFSLTCVAAWPYAAFYENELFRTVVPAVGLSAAIQGFASTKVMRLGRHLQLGRLVGLELGSQGLGILVTVGLCLRFPSVWALVIGRLVTALVHTALTFVLLPGRNDRFRWEAEARDEIIRFGRWILVSSLLTFTAASTDKLVIGKVLGLRVLGIYGIAAGLAQMPATALAQVADRVVFPTYSRLKDSGKDLAKVFEGTRGPLLLLASWILSTMIAAGVPVIDLLYDDRYLGAGRVLQILALSVWFDILDGTNGSALKALGRPRALATGTAARVVAIMAFLPLLAQWGLEAATWGLVVASLCGCVVSTWTVCRLGLTHWHRPVPLLLGFVAFGAAGVLASRPLQDSPLVSIAVATLVTTACWAIPAWRQIPREMLRGKRAGA